MGLTPYKVDPDHWERTVVAVFMDSIDPFHRIFNGSPCLEGDSGSLPLPIVGCQFSIACGDKKVPAKTSRVQ